MQWLRTNESRSTERERETLAIQHSVSGATRTAVNTDDTQLTGAIHVPRSTSGEYRRGVFHLPTHRERDAARGQDCGRNERYRSCNFHLASLYIAAFRNTPSGA